MFHASSHAKKTVLGATYSGSRIDGTVVGRGSATTGAVPARARSAPVFAGIVAVMRVAAPGAIALQVTP